MHRTFIVAAVLAAGLSLAPAAHAGDRPGAAPDRAAYNRLSEQIRETDRELAQAMQEAMREAREGGGKAPLETQSRILALRERRDRLMGRITLVALRHGWRLPDQEPDASAEPEQKSFSDQFFEPAADMIRARFAAESRRIAASVELPVVSVGPAKETER